ncbi:MAG: molybdopterin-dependent oxidoreductase [Synergistaceae bacterium]|jgi:anaerobic selenocysteine-containing dehydrogenase|nr:molybdopterin-dependent oxidoreductase [Synergistaceae bacterium]
MSRITRLAAKIPGPDTGIEVKKSLCTICDPLTQCGLDVYVADGRIIKIEGSEEHPFNKGALCAKGAANRQYVYHENRIKTPLRRVGPRGSDTFEPISWDEALDVIGEGCVSAKSEYGSESVIFFSGYTKYFRPYLRRLARSFGSPNYCTESSTCFMAMAMAQKLVFGAPGGPDMANTDCLMVWSSNPYHTAHGRGAAIDRALSRGMKMIVVDPRQTPTTSRADIHLRPRPGTDGALALSMANVIIGENIYDADFVSNYTYGFEEYREYASTFTPERGEDLTGVPAAGIRAAARMFATAGRACVMPSASPVVHHTNGVQNYRAVFMLAALTGNYDVKGGNFVEPPSYLYVSGKMKTQEEEFENPKPLSEMAARIGNDRLPVWMEVANGEAQAMLIPEQLRTGKPYPLKCLIGFGMNYRMWPDSEGFLKSWQNLDLIVNTDIFMTDTCRQSDIVLPACTSLERSELRCHAMGYVQLSSAAIEPLYESRSDVDIVFDLAKRLCPDDPLFKQGYRACVDWILSPSGLTVDELERNPGGMFLKNPIMPPERKYKNGARTPSGKIEFKSKILEKYGERPGFESLPVYTPPKYSPEAAPEMAKEYPFILNTGSRLPMFIHSRVNHLSWIHSLRSNHPAADINPEDAKSLNIAQNDDLRISTPFGSIEVKANPTEMVMKGVVHMFHGWGSADVNQLFEWDYLDPISGFPGYKSSLCKIERIGGARR